MSNKSLNQSKTKSNTRPDKPVNRLAAKKPLTPEEKARIIRDRLANRPIIVFRYPNGKLNKRFILMLALLIIAMVVALFFVSRM